MNKMFTAELLEKEKEIELLRARLAELEGGDDPDEKKIQLDDYIPVMSLIPYRLNLTTKEGGGGDVKKFSRFGEVKNILYRDLVDIMEAHPNFLEAGYFYIMDKRVIRQHGLDDTYSKILTKEKIEEILSTSSDKGLELYNTANEEQQKVIIDLLILKIKEDPSVVNLNMVDRISRASGIDISKKAEESREFDKMKQTEE